MAAKKTVKKTVKKSAKKAEKSETSVLSRSQLISGDAISKTALRTIEKIDAIDASFAARAELLKQLVNELGGQSFDHPTKGPMCIMVRGDGAFWREKPAGRIPGTRPAKKAAAKPAKKAAKKAA